MSAQILEPRRTWRRSAAYGRQAVVVGAGMAGLAATAALAEHFEQVTVLDRDTLRSDGRARPGVPQSSQLHGLLAGGLRALCTLLPGFDRDLSRAGAVQLRFGLDDCMEVPGCDPFPRRELGVEGYAITRPLLELTLRERVRHLPNVRLREQCRVVELVAGDGGSVTAVRCQGALGADQILAADLVVDASARGALTEALLEATGWPAVERSVVGIDMHYATTTFEIPEGRRDWKLVMTYPDGQADTKTGYLIPVAADRWMCTVGERHRPAPPSDEAGFRELARQLRTPTIHEAISAARCIDRVHRFAFPESSWRHYERLAGFPRGLLPIGDAICRFNPIHALGMTVAAKEACILKDLLRTRSVQHDPLAGLGEAFIAAAQPVIDAAWSISAVPDFAHPLTRGERPAGLGEALQSTMALTRLAVRDAAVHKLLVAVRQMIEPMSALHAPEVMRRVEMEMAA